MKTLLVDLYDTIAWVEWPTLSERLAARLGVGAERLRRAFDLTRSDRGTGRFGSVAGDLAAVAAACGIIADDAFLDRRPWASGRSGSPASRPSARRRTPARIPSSPASASCRPGSCGRVGSVEAR
jgi:hypothetical protein